MVIFLISRNSVLSDGMLGMKFCPKCGSVLVPSRRGGKLVLKCPRCGYEEEVKEVAKREYTIETKSNASKIKTTSVISEGKEIMRKKEELEQEKEEFYEVFLELMSEEEGS